MTSADPKHPETYPRRALLAVAGLSPQIVTETLYALSVLSKPAFIPTEIHLITTRQGAERARLMLLSEKPGWMRQFCRDFRLPRLLLPRENIHIHIIGGLDDIRTPDDNRQVADEISEQVRRLTLDPGLALHVSIAGGRKTMGFYAGYALSLFARLQDRLSHVLVSSPYESNPDFFYPAPRSRIIYTPGPQPEPIDAHEAKVWLAEIPFVRLRQGLPENLQSGRASFSDTIAALNRALAPPKLALDLAGGFVLCGEQRIQLAPAELAFLAWFARRATAGQAGIERQNITGVLAREFLAEYRSCLKNPENGSLERAAIKKLSSAGMDAQDFDYRRSRLHHKLRRQLGAAAAAYMVQGLGKRNETRYALGLNPEQIHFLRPPVRNYV